MTDRQIEYLLMCRYEHTRALQTIKAQLQPLAPERVRRAVWRLAQARRRDPQRARYWREVRP